MANEQQTLFDDELAPATPVLEQETDCEVIDAPESKLKEWSYSRREVFEKCQRLYYYQYYGARSRTAQSDSQKPRIQFLKQISNRHLRAGDIMHWAISCSLRSRATKGSEWSPAFLVEFARKKFQSDLAFSRNYREGTAIQKGSSTPVLLMEFYYGMGNAEQVCSEVEAKMVRALQNFQTANEYHVFRAGTDSDQVKIETSVSVKHQGVSLRGKVDLAYAKSGRATVVDWKMGEGDAGTDSLQLLFYAIWAMNTFGCHADHVDLFKAYLGSASVSQFEFGEDSILRAKARISQDVERMRAVDGYGRDGVADAFTPCGQDRVCAGCVFQGVCPKE